jgi:hypothetical protein
MLGKPSGETVDFHGKTVDSRWIDRYNHKPNKKAARGRLFLARRAALYYAVSP